MDVWVQRSLRDNNHERKQKYCTTAAAVGHGQKQGKQKSYVRIAMPLFDDDPHAISFLSLGMSCHTYQIRGTRQEFVKSMTG